jgi:hypothetical protein
MLGSRDATCRPGCKKKAGRRSEGRSSCEARSMRPKRQTSSSAATTRMLPTSFGRKSESFKHSLFESKPVSTLARHFPRPNLLIPIGSLAQICSFQLVPSPKFAHFNWFPRPNLLISIGSLAQICSFQLVFAIRRRRQDLQLWCGRMFPVRNQSRSWRLV